MFLQARFQETINNQEEREIDLKTGSRKQINKTHNNQEEKEVSLKMDNKFQIKIINKKGKIDNEEDSILEEKHQVQSINYSTSQIHTN